MHKQTINDTYCTWGSHRSIVSFLQATSTWFILTLGIREGLELMQMWLLPYLEMKGIQEKRNWIMPETTLSVESKEFSALKKSSSRFL